MLSQGTEIAEKLAKELSSFCTNFIMNSCISLTFDKSPLRATLRFSDEAEAHFEGDQFCSDLAEPQDLEKWQPSKESQEIRNPFRGRRRNMKTGTKDEIKGSFHEVKGTIKEEVGKITSDPNLKAEGKAEKKAGKVQQRIGHAKEAVANLKEQLADLKKTG